MTGSSRSEGPATRLNSATLAGLGESLNAHGPADGFRDYRREVLLRVVDDDRADRLRLRITVDGGVFRVIDGTGPASEDVLTVVVDLRTARAIGSADSLVENELAAGGIDLDGVRADDYRQAPVLEALFELLVDGELL